MARLGFHVTGIDISKEFLQKLQTRIDAENLPVNILHGDVMAFQIPNAFDAAYCLGNSFGYVDYEGMNLFVGNVSSALKTGAKFVINSGLVAESILTNFPITKQFVLGDLTMDISNSYNYCRELHGDGIELYQSRKN